MEPSKAEIQPAVPQAIETGRKEAQQSENSIPVKQIGNENIQTKENNRTLKRESIAKDSIMVDNANIEVAEDLNEYGFSDNGITYNVTIDDGKNVEKVIEPTESQ